jgi:hypothetical protein
MRKLLEGNGLRRRFGQAGLKVSDGLAQVLRGERSRRSDGIFGLFLLSLSRKATAQENNTEDTKQPV